MIGFIGGGNMAEAMIKGMIQNNMKDIIVSEPRAERRVYLEKNYNVISTNDNISLVNKCNIIIIAVKPQNMDEVTSEIAEYITPEKFIISIAAGITLSYLTSKLKTSKIIRVMPNTPALVQEGMSVLSLCECFPDNEMTFIRGIFMSIGKVMVLPEKYMDAVTALSGSGPGFLAFIIEKMIEAGVKAGLSRDAATELAIQTFIGTAKLLETGMPPSKLREMVTSPGGTTAAGLKVFEEKGLQNLIDSVILAAVERSRELGRKE
ncbi:MAG: pyrroline-5-carboxylate reductase [Nitrospirae bacterium]|jgi:pyrroline-5-carboxylate reductase|nr:pyrroline-5-carboxylate reductase [Nitrospirota bacterium]